MLVGKAELFCDIELLKGPQLVEVEGLLAFEKLWFEFLEAWKLLVSSCQRKLVERRQRSEPASRSADFQLRRVRRCLHQAPGPWVAPGESASTTAGRTPLRPRFDLPRLQGGFPVKTEGHSASGGGSEAGSSPFRMTRLQLPTSWTARTGDSGEVEQMANEHVLGVGRMLLGHGVSS